MKRVMIIPEGVVDGPVEALRERTPLAAARTPALDDLARRGRIGVANYVPPREPARPHTALLSALGYDPREYPVGRAWLQIAAAGADVPADAWPLMADFVTVSDVRSREIVRDLRSAELSALLDALNELGAERGVRFQEMEGRAVVTGFADLLRLRAMPPDEALDQRSSRCAPRGAGARTLRQFASRAAAVLMSHDINAVRRDLGENPADQLWLWGSGPAPRMPALGERWDVGAVGIAVDPMALGAFRLAGIDVVEPNDNQPTSLAHAAIDALHSCHLVIVYADAAQLASLAGDVFGKVAAIEAIDAELIAPVRRRLAEESQWRMLIAPTIAAEVELRCYSSESTIVCLAGHDIESSREAAFDEDHAEVGEMDIERGWELMEHFLLR